MKGTISPTKILYKTLMSKKNTSFTKIAELCLYYQP
jgi:hypothetical protein